MRPTTALVVNRIMFNPIVASAPIVLLNTATVVFVTVDTAYPAHAAKYVDTPEALCTSPTLQAKKISN